MSRSSNSLRSTDVITTPIKLKYTSSYTYCTMEAYGIEVLNGVNGPVTVTGSIPQDTLNYRSIRNLYYSNYLTGSFPVSASSADNYLQSTAASGTFDADIRYFPTQSDATIKVLSIPRGVFGQQISRRGFRLLSDLYAIVDDGNGNLIDIQTNTLYVTMGYYIPEGYDWYVYQGAGGIHVGNIIYGQGMVIITNPDYQNLFSPIYPTANADTTTFASTFTPKTFDILANDNSGSGVLDPLSVILSGSDVGLFTNNYDSTVTLTTTTPGTYTTYYTVASDIGYGCSLESNQALITVTLTPPPTTTTTTTSTTTTTTTAAPTTTTTTTTTTAAPTSTTTTTSTSTTTTTPAPTTTTTTSTTTTTTTAAPTTTTTTSTTTTTTTAANYTVDVYAKSSDVAAAWFYQIQYSLNGGGTWTNIGNTFRTTSCTNLSSTVTVPAGSSITFQVVDDQSPNPGYLYQFGLANTTSCPSSGALCVSSPFTVTGNIDRAFWVNTDFTLC